MEAVMVNLLRPLTGSFNHPATLVVKGKRRATLDLRKGSGRPEDCADQGHSGGRAGGSKGRDAADCRLRFDDRRAEGRGRTSTGNVLLRPRAGHARACGTRRLAAELGILITAMMIGYFAGQKNHARDFSTPPAQTPTYPVPQSLEPETTSMRFFAGVESVPGLTLPGNQRGPVLDEGRASALSVG